MVEAVVVVVVVVNRAGFEVKQVRGENAGKLPSNKDGREWEWEETFGALACRVGGVAGGSSLAQRHVPRWAELVWTTATTKLVCEV